MGLRRAAQRLGMAAGSWPGSPWGWGVQQPFNSQQAATQKYLDLILSRLAPGTPPSAIGGALFGGAGGARMPLSTFRPSRLYPKQQRFTAEDAAFWSVIATNVGVLIAAKSEVPGASAFTLRHMRASIEALIEGRFYTLATAVVAHYSVIHCALNLAVLAMFRRTEPVLPARQFLALFWLGALATSVAHVGYCWWDAGGHKYGLRYAINTPAFMGCSGGVAAVTAYKAVLAPASMQVVLGALPVPVLFAAVLFVNLDIQEAEYADLLPAKMGGAVVGTLAALMVLLTRGRARPPVT